MRLLGNKGEDLAAKFLRKQGYRIIRRNYSAPSGEIDIIAEDRGTVVFVEVKTRTDDLFGLPVEAVGYRKRLRMIETALHYLSRLKKQPPARFDIVCVNIRGKEKEVEHIRDAFDMGKRGV